MKYSNNSVLAVGKDWKIPFPVFTLGLRRAGMSYQGRATSSGTSQSSLRNVPGMTQGTKGLRDPKKRDGDGWEQ